MTHWRQQDRCICPWCYVQAKLHSSVWSKSREDSPNLDKIDYLSSFVGGHRVVLEFVDADLLRPLTISISTYIRFAMSQECDSERWRCGVTRSNWRRLHIQVNFMCGLRPKLTSCRLLEAYMILYTQSWYIWWADNDPYPQLINPNGGDNRIWDGISKHAIRMSTYPPSTSYMWEMVSYLLCRIRVKDERRTSVRYRRWSKNQGIW